MTNLSKNHKKIEILAPAGSYASFKAAILAGADAVYAGGSRFGARAFAGNFTEAELLEAIDYAHIHGRKLYLTVNTLLKEEELGELYEYLKPFYQKGLDAVIVQDIGVLASVRLWFPKMDIHASTQMTITNTEGALFLKEQGVARVVPARELSLQEVNDIAEQTGLEMECFVHGALCYCYSGQCLLSSVIGGRSGNRGQCAQPCRLPYTVDEKKEYVLSLKDICTLEMIPDLIENGIDSFKIEGRMKKPEYVALVTSMYRKYTDLYLQKGRTSFKVLKEDIEMLLDIYNRGGFSQGYYKQHNGRDMLSLERPNHAGVPAVKVASQRGREAVLTAITCIHKGDILELSVHKDEKSNYTFGVDLLKGEQIQILLPKGIVFPKDTILYRIRNQKLLDCMQEQFGSGTIQEPVSGSFYAAVGQPAVLNIQYKEYFISVSTDTKTEAAKNQPLDETRIRKQLMKTGEAEFCFESLAIELTGPVFLPMQQINELRRNALELLKEELCKAPEIEPCVGLENQKAETVNLKTQNLEIENSESQNLKSEAQKNQKPYLSVLAETIQQAEVALNHQSVSRIYLDGSAEWDLSQEDCILQVCKKAKEKQIEIYFAMPHIFRTEAADYFLEKFHVFEKADFTGVLVRNYESYHFLKKQGFDKKIILDHNLYVFNQSAKQFWRNIGVEQFTAPVELNQTELGVLGIEDAELIGYGRLPVMISAQCAANTTSGCKKRPGTTVLQDRYQKEFRVRNCCRFCYTVMYHTETLCLFDQKKEIQTLLPAGIRLQFSSENGNETKRILDLYQDCYCDGNIELTEGLKFTKGHFKRGIT